MMRNSAALLDLAVTIPARAEGSASDEAHPSEENRRADERGHQRRNASDELQSDRGEPQGRRGGQE
jgi:hypothetical protein